MTIGKANIGDTGDPTSELGTTSHLDELPLVRQVLSADEFTGGRGHRSFFSREQCWAGGNWRAHRQQSVTRQVITLAGEDGGKERQVQCRFQDTAATGGETVRQTIMRVRGMWGYQADMPGEWGQLHSTVPTVGRFHVVLNDQVTCDREVVFWNYRKWRSWPCWEIEVPSALMHPTGNVLLIENRTRSFFDHIPAALRAVYGEAKLEGARAELPERFWKNTVFHLAEVQLVSRHFHDLEVLNRPWVVHLEEPFTAEVFAVGPHHLETVWAKGLEILSPRQLHRGRQVLHLVAHELGAGCSVRFQSERTGQYLDIVVEHVLKRGPAPELYLGHLIGGHLSAFAWNHNYRRDVELFRDTEQGNLVCWLTSPRKAGDYITLDQLPVDDLRANRLHVALRFGSNPGPPYAEELSRMIRGLKGQFLGVGVEECGGSMAGLVEQTPDRNQAYRQFQANLRERLDAISALGSNVPVWVNDPSLYADVYRPMGIRMAGTELFVLQCNFEIASIRGTVRAWNDPGFIVKDALECQAFGGLAMPEPFAEQDPRFDEKRGHLWWLSLFHSYLAGARMIYSESGPFHHVVGRQWDFEDAVPMDMRRSQRELWRFARFHGLCGLPVAAFAFVKAPGDIFSDVYGPPPTRTTPRDQTWSRLRVAWPDARYRNPSLEALREGDGPTRSDYAATPFGEVDIINADVPLATMQHYQSLALVGTHVLTDAQVDRLHDYAAAGGTLVLTHYDLLDESGPDSLSNAKLHRLCGVRCREPYEDGWLWELEALDDLFTPALAGFIRPNHDSRGLCGAFLPSLEVSGAVEIVLRDRYTDRSVLLRRPLGKGSVWLVNVVDYPDSSIYQLLANRILATVWDTIHRPIRIEKHSYINHFHYPTDEQDQKIDRAFLLNNDWFTSCSEYTTNLCMHNMDVAVTVPRRSVRMVYATPAFLLLPSGPWLRINRCVHTGDRQWQVTVQCDVEVSLRVVGAHSRWRIRRRQDPKGQETRDGVTFRDAGIYELEVCE